jgi:hypothetical protein
MGFDGRAVWEGESGERGGPVPGAGREGGPLRGDGGLVGGLPRGNGVLVGGPPLLCPPWVDGGRVGLRSGRLPAGVEGGPVCGPVGLWGGLGNWLLSGGVVAGRDGGVPRGGCPPEFGGPPVGGVEGGWLSATLVTPLTGLIDDGDVEIQVAG